MHPSIISEQMVLKAMMATATEQLQLQFHEEEALNRAILLSLQSADIDTDNNTEAGQNGTDDEEVAFIPDERSVEIITAMGFQESRPWMRCEERVVTLTEQ